MNKRIYPAECVLPGHPDKLCDAIADALVERAAAAEQRSLCGVEVALHMASVFITGRIAGAGACDIDIESVVRTVFADVGYGSGWQPAPECLEIRTALCTGPLKPDEAGFRSVSDDQSILTGYAVENPEANYLPPEHWLAARLGRRLEKLRTERPELKLGPDGKLIVLCEPDERKLECFSVSLQQAIGGDEIELNRAVRAAVARAAIRPLGHFRPDLREWRRQLRSGRTRGRQRSERQETGRGCLRTSRADRRWRPERQGFL